MPISFKLVATCDTSDRAAQVCELVAGFLGDAHLPDGHILLQICKKSDHLGAWSGDQHVVHVQDAQESTISADKQGWFRAKSIQAELPKFCYKPVLPQSRGFALPVQRAQDSSNVARVEYDDLQNVTARNGKGLPLT